jgi:flagellar biogenesis protein FliO
MNAVRTYALVAAAVLAATFAVVPAMAQKAALEAVESPTDEGGYLPETGEAPASVSALDIAGKLVITLVVAWGAVRAVRWWHERVPASPGEGGRGGRRMWLEETLPLGADGRLYLVEVEGRRMLLSASEGSVVEVATLNDEPAAPSAYRSVRRRADGSVDELNVAGGKISTRAVRPDVVEGDGESWEQRRGRLLRELQEQG